MHKGAIAAGHPLTTAAAAAMLEEGGNAFDAALAGLAMSCVCEPVLASLGGGGFLLAAGAEDEPRLYDFFVQTPKRRPPHDEQDFHPILADFGTAQQEFHIGMAAIATPGVVQGLCTIHEDLCRLPLPQILAPAVAAAREGVAVNGFQHYIATIVEPILRSSAAAFALHTTTAAPNHLAHAGDLVRQPEMAAVLEALGREGADLFYRGELAQQLVRDCRENGGCLESNDLHDYRVILRQPIGFRYRGCQLFANPPPSLGGTLIAFTLGLLADEPLGACCTGGADHMLRIASALVAVQRLRDEERVDHHLDEQAAQQLLSSDALTRWRQALRAHPAYPRGTTQISVLDAAGNAASMTLSNGEGCGYVLPGTGIMLNNMLGEEDINPHGFQHWPQDVRIASMMSPTLVRQANGAIVATGSGGSNRIRSAITQVLSQLLDFKVALEHAVRFPRLHFENGLLSIEGGLPAEATEALIAAFPQHHVWPGRNLFFGGAHSVCRNANGSFEAAGDPRRGGAGSVV